MMQPILPAMFMESNPKLQMLNVMHLNNPETAILSTLIFNAIVIPALTYSYIATRSKIQARTSAKDIS